MLATAAEIPLGEADRATILVVEDELLIRLMIADALRAAGFSVIEAMNADEALAVLRAGVSIDLVMTDIRVPGPTDGLGLADTVRPTWPDHIRRLLAKRASRT